RSADRATTLRPLRDARDRERREFPRGGIPLRRRRRPRRRRELALVPQRETRRRADVGEALEALQVRVGELGERLERWEDASAEERERSRELARILDRVVDIGLRGGWAELQDTPLQIPRIQLNIPRLASTENEQSPSPTESNTKLDSQ
ncbi:hypothetical protein EDB87DRAFT_1689997, partial [Lactarius vividus]